MNLFEVYPSDERTTWKLLCDGCYGWSPARGVKSIRVVRTDFQLCSNCYAAFRRQVAK